MKKAIIIGASTGIGRAVAQGLLHKGYKVGITARRGEVLKELSQGQSGVYTMEMDLTQTEAAREQLRSLVKEMGGADIILISAGTGAINPELAWEKEAATLDLNVKGFAAVAIEAFSIFKEQGHGHLVGISSIASFMGSGGAPAYGASKAFVSLYLEGLREAGKKLGIKVTDIRPGFVDTAMAQGDGLFWVAPVDKAAQQIIRSIEKGQSIVYITRRWRLVAWLLKARRLFT